jgi:hypothetical protein
MGDYDPLDFPSKYDGIGSRSDAQDAQDASAARARVRLTQPRQLEGCITSAFKTRFPSLQLADDASALLLTRLMRRLTDSAAQLIKLKEPAENSNVTPHDIKCAVMFNARVAETKGLADEIDRVSKLVQAWGAQQRAAAAARKQAREVQRAELETGGDAGETSPDTTQSLPPGSGGASAAAAAAPSYTFVHSTGSKKGKATGKNMPKQKSMQEALAMCFPPELMGTFLTSFASNKFPLKVGNAAAAAFAAFAEASLQLDFDCVDRETRTNTETFVTRAFLTAAFTDRKAGHAAQIFDSDDEEGVVATKAAPSEEQLAMRRDRALRAAATRKANRLLKEQQQSAAEVSASSVSSILQYESTVGDEASVAASDDEPLVVPVNRQPTALNMASEDDQFTEAIMNLVMSKLPGQFDDSEMPPMNPTPATSSAQTMSSGRPPRHAAIVARARVFQEIQLLPPESDDEDFQFR